MKSCHFRKVSALACILSMGVAATVGIGLSSRTAAAHEVKDLKYGAILFEFFQQKYFETLVEYAYAAERGGIHNHGDYPELLKGGVSLSYGLDVQARQIFSKLIAEQTSEDVQNRAWFYLAKMLYLRGETERAAETLANIHGTMPHDVDQEYRYLAALVNVKLGYFDAAEAVSESFDDESPYAPYLYFNLGVALGKEKEYARAVSDLKKAASYADGSGQLNGLADRSHMAIAYLYAEGQNFADAYNQIKQVGASGMFSNRALLGSGWAAVNKGAYREALTPLTALQKRSMAIPEVQEAVLLVPHVYEKLGLVGRAAKGFIVAYDRYDEALEQVSEAAETLKDADVLELFVRNLDQMLGESDWFGTAPSVSLNALSPFLIDLMSDHSFQSVLKDLRDLYAIRNNLNNWKRKRDDFEVILAARSASLDVKGRQKKLARDVEQQHELQTRYTTLARRAATLGKEDQERVRWLLDDVAFELNSAKVMVAQLHGASGVSMNTDGYARRVGQNMKALDQELENTEALIAKVENVLLALVKTELDIHEQRLKYYQVQSHLAKVRILDRSLSEREEPVGEEAFDAPAKGNPPAPEGSAEADGKGGGDEA